MIKIITLLMFCSLIMNIQVASAKETIARPGGLSDSPYDVEQEFNFEQNSYNISDEQLKDLENIDKIEDENVGFIQKIINSSHFSSNTATRTWIPINRQK